MLSDGFRWCRVPGGRLTTVSVDPAVTRTTRQLPIPGGGATCAGHMCAGTQISHPWRVGAGPQGLARPWRHADGCGGCASSARPGQHPRGDSGGCEGPAEKASECHRGGSVGDHGTSAFLNSPGGYGPGTGQPAVVLRGLEALRLGTPGHSPRQAKTESSKRQYVRSPVLTSDISSGKCLGHYDRHALGWRPPGSLSTAAAPWSPAGRAWRHRPGALAAAGGAGRAVRV